MNPAKRPHSSGFELSIETVDDDAFGVGRHDGLVVHVPGAAPGDRVCVALSHRSPHRTEAWATLLGVVERGPAFTAPRCHHAAPLRGRCGGCAAMHLCPSAQRTAKLQLVHRAFASAGLAAELLSQVEPSPHDWGYRNRCNYIVAPRPPRPPLLGSWAPRSHDFARMDGCPVAREPIARVAAAIAGAWQGLRTEALPKWLSLRAFGQGASARVLADLVYADATVDDEASECLRGLPELVGVTRSSTGAGNAIRGSAARRCWGESELRERFGTLDLWVGAASFSQLNTEVASAMMATAAAFLPSCPRLWELYCGLGGLGLAVAPQGELWGCDSVPTSLELARRNAAERGFRAQYECRDLGLGVPPDWPRPDAVIVNPPRRGLDRAVRDVLPSLRVPVVYMSCSAASFAQDAAAWAREGLQLRNSLAFDMLPQTPHVELLGLFSPD